MTRRPVVKANEVVNYLESADFESLFNYLNWNLPRSNSEIPIQIEENICYRFKPIGERNGYMVYTCEVNQIPNNTLRRKLDTKLSNRSPYYIAIFYISGTVQQEWMVPVKRPEKRDIVTVSYQSSNQTSFLMEKLPDIKFRNNENIIYSDVFNRVQKAFLVNSEGITKKFYDGFKKEHNNFAKLIQNIDNDQDLKWYTSIMLNRPMFCYFIQKKRFLNNDPDYLRNKLDEHLLLKQQNETFYQSFYKDFLRVLFSDGLNQRDHNQDFENRFGKIPYLNGGMFECHPIEEKYTNLDIDDEAFNKLFTFFDKWHWHLDSCIEATGKDINPDVLGYIFEQYINNRADIGAYYTKEDITEYISKNCIIPYLLDTLSNHECVSSNDFKPDGYVWQTMKNSGIKYIYDAVKKGYSDDWKKQIPKEIAEGLDTTKPNLLERRKHWNDKTPESFALPTEIWRETIARLQRCEELKRKIEAGEISNPNDLITYNLDMRQFAHDLIKETKSAQFVSDFARALQKITILDPTCGSGAFLFAALNILEPLYEVCIERMQEFISKPPKNEDAHVIPFFEKQLNKIHEQFRSNIQYFIYKTIILNNLYGVDIMPEAVETAKLRLFLKLVEVVEVDNNCDNLGLDSLPDIDFNIRCGNTLIGCVTKEELKTVIRDCNLFNHKEAQEKYSEIITYLNEDVARSYTNFLNSQSETYKNIVSISKHKDLLKETLRKLKEDLNKYYYKATQANIQYNDWLASHQPFHWLAEFYPIMEGNKGFDVIIGNPPYVEYNKKSKKTNIRVSDIYKLNPNYFQTIKCGNLYAYVLERCYALNNSNSINGYIIPSASISTPRMSKFYNLCISKGVLWTSLYDERPSKLFDGVDQQLSIYIQRVFKAHNQNMYISNMHHFYPEERCALFDLSFYKMYKQTDIIAKVPPKIILPIEEKIIHKLLNCPKTIIKNSNTHNQKMLYYKNAGGRYWRLVKSFPTYYYNYKKQSNTTSTEKSILVDEKYIKSLVATFSSCTFYWFWRVVSNCRHFTSREMENFRIPENIYSDTTFFKLSEEYEICLSNNKSRIIEKGKEYDKYYVKRAKPIIDEIDKVLAKHYGFTDEELDFIINYDIKYRMGDELDDNDDELNPEDDE